MISLILPAHSSQVLQIHILAPQSFFPIFLLCSCIFVISFPFHDPFGVYSPFILIKIITDVHVAITNDQSSVFVSFYLSGAFIPIDHFLKVPSLFVFSWCCYYSQFILSYFLCSLFLMFLISR